MMVAFYEMYGTDWDIDGMIANRDIKTGHPSLDHVDAEVAARRVAAFIESWLYFGLLETVTGVPISSTYMVRAGADGVDYLYSRMLPVLLQTWAKDLNTMGEDVAGETFEAAIECSFRASSILTVTITDLSKYSESSAFFELKQYLLTVEPAISALHEAIATFARVSLRSDTRSFNLAQSPLPKTYSESLIRKGWCRFIVANAEVALSAAFMRFIDTAGYVGTTGGHENCVAEACYRNNVDTTNYTPQHRKADCHCNFMKPDLSAVLSILNNGQIPVVRPNEDDLSLAVVALDDDDRRADYVAFSHVWADGLGSTTEAGLPSCQVQRLHKLAIARGTGGSFWIDALCVPKQQPQRQKAIKLMNQTYENAARVVIIDQGIGRLSMASSDLELGWSIFASGWFGRLWTYQEGYLAKRVDVDLGGNLLDLYGIIQRLYNRCYCRPEGNPFPSVFVFELLAMLQKIRPLDSQSRQRPRLRRLVDLFNALTRRQTSRSTDQFVVIGLLLDLDTSQGTTLMGEERWKDLYIRIGRIPWTVVFDQRPKMTMSSFTWAPSNWISTGGDRWLHYNDEEANITENGLTVTLKVLILDEVTEIGFSYLVLETTEPHFYEVSRAENEADANPRLSKFDVVFARYFKAEDPGDVLYDNRSVLLAVGLGLKGETSVGGSVLLQHDFREGWEIREIVDMRELERENQPRIRASWTELKCCFT